MQAFTFHPFPTIAGERLMIIDFFKSIIGKVIAFFGYVFALFGVMQLYDGDLISGFILLIVLGLMPIQSGRRLQKKREYFSGIYASVDQGLITRTVRLAALHNGRLTALEAANHLGVDLDEMNRILAYLEQADLTQKMHVRHMDTVADVYDFPDRLSAEQKAQARTDLGLGRRPVLSPVLQIYGKLYEWLRFWRGTKEKALLALVAAHGGRITMSDVLLNSDLPHNEALLLLDHYLSKQVVVQQACEHRGVDVAVYAFPGIISRSDKAKARHMSGSLKAHETAYGDADALAEELIKEKGTKHGQEKK